MSLVAQLAVRVRGRARRARGRERRVLPGGRQLAAPAWSTKTHLSFANSSSREAEFALFRLRPRTRYTRASGCASARRPTRPPTTTRTTASSRGRGRRGLRARASRRVGFGAAALGRRATHARPPARRERGQRYGCAPRWTSCRANGRAAFRRRRSTRIEKVHAFEQPGWQMLTFAYQADVEESDRAVGGARARHTLRRARRDRRGGVGCVRTTTHRRSAGISCRPTPSGAAGGVVLMADELKRTRTWRTVDDDAATNPLHEPGGAKSDDGDDANGGADSRVWLANSQLQHITPFGELVTQFVQGCTGRALNFNQLTHELKVDRSSRHLDALVLRQRARAYPNVSLTWDGAAEERVAHVDALLGTALMRWRRTARTPRARASATTRRATAACSSRCTTSSTTRHPTRTRPRCPRACRRGLGRAPGCSANEANASSASREMLDYHHASSAAAGPDGNVLVASRNPQHDLVLSFRRLRTAVMLSSSLEKPRGGAAERGRFSFERDADRFFSPHSATQLNETTLLLLDDGTNRPGCARDAVRGLLVARGALPARLCDDACEARVAIRGAVPAAERRRDAVRQDGLAAR